MTATNIITAFSVLYIIVFSLTFIKLSKEGSVFEELLRKQANKRNGCFKRNIFGYPYFEFIRNQNKVLFYFVSGGRGSSYIVTANIGQFKNIYFWIYKHGDADIVFNYKKIGLGNNLFDSKFVVKGNNPDFIKKIITLEVVNKLLEHKTTINRVIFKSGELQINVSKYLLNFSKDLTVDEKALDAVFDFFNLLQDSIISN